MNQNMAVTVIWLLMVFGVPALVVWTTKHYTGWPKGGVRVGFYITVLVPFGVLMVGSLVCGASLLPQCTH